MINEIEIYNIFHLLDKLFMSDVRTQFTEDVQFFFDYCITSDRQEYLLLGTTFETMRVQLHSRLDFLEQQQKGNQATTSLTNLLFRYLMDVLVSLQSRLHSESLVTNTEMRDSAVHFIHENMKYFTLELFYLFEALNSQLNQEGSLFQCARFVCSIRRITAFVDTLIAVSLLKNVSTLSVYIALLLKHLGNLSKATLNKLRPYQGTAKDECLFIVDLFVRIKQGLDHSTTSRLSHVYNDVTFKECDNTRNKIMKYNQAFFDTMMNRLERGSPTIGKVVHFQTQMKNYLLRKESTKQDYSQKFQAKKIIQEDDTNTNPFDLDVSIDILNKSKKFRQSENNPYTSQMAVIDPDLMMNKHDFAEVVDHNPQGPSMQFRMSKIIENELASEQSQISIKSVKLQRSGSFEAEKAPNYDAWRNFDLSELTNDAQHRPGAFKPLQEEFILDSEEDERPHKEKR